jgi:hypothetical protein
LDQPSHFFSKRNDGTTKWRGGSAMRRSGSPAGTFGESRAGMRTAARARAWASDGSVARCGPGGGGLLRCVVPALCALGLLEGCALDHRAQHPCARRPVHRRERSQLAGACVRLGPALACLFRNLPVSPHRSPRNLSSTGATRPSPTRSRSSRDRDQLHAAWCGMAVEQSLRTYLTTPSARTRWARLSMRPCMCVRIHVPSGSC